MPTLDILLGFWEKKFWKKNFFFYFFQISFKTILKIGMIENVTVISQGLEESIKNETLDVWKRGKKC
mgnify:CR=1 FL=1